MSADSLEIPLAALETDKLTPPLLVNRELSWLDFNHRVLEEARDPSVPLLERLKFMSICASNLDEFFMVRVAGLLGQKRDQVTTASADGLTPSDQLSAISRRVHSMREEMSESMLREILPGLAERGVKLVTTSQVGSKAKTYLNRHFREQVLPVLTPLAIDPGHPFPHLRNRSLNIIAMLQGAGQRTSEPAFAIVQVPGVLSRLLRVPVEEKDGARAVYVLLDDLIASHVAELFPGFRCLGAWPFRIIRNFDLSIDEEEAEDLLDLVSQELRRRDRGNAVCMMIDSRVHEKATEMLRESVGLENAFIFSADGPLNLPDLVAMGETLDHDPTLRDEPFVGQVLSPFRGEEDLFAVIAKRDVVLHHPYESFDSVVQLIEQAASDPNVLAIKQTLYRTSFDSPIVKALMRAADNNKQVTALVEIKARFDEANNILWARRLEEAGVHVVYGLVGLKTHAKACLIVRREEGKLQRYVHLGTGNYNPVTSRHYTDISLFTAREEFGEDASSLFNLLTSCTAPATWKKLVVAPLGLHERILGLIEREAALARAGKPARIIAKMNSLVDSDVITALYRASTAGVSIDLLVRGICCLRPGVAGLSENIRVRSVVDRFLEHARIFYFEGGGLAELYCSSADWMPRNFQRRVEVLFPIEDAGAKARLLDQILGTELKDNVKSRTVLASGERVRETVDENAPRVRSQQVFMQIAREARVDEEAHERVGRPFVVRPVRHRPSTEMLDGARESQSEPKKIS